MPDTPYYRDDQVTLYLGDSLDVLPTLADASVDAVVCDPPYGLAELATATVLQAVGAWMAGDRTHVPDGRGFMARDWDRFVPPPGIWDQCLRVLKPGGHLLAFAGSRTADLMGLSIRIAGFQIRDTITWNYGSGFPKSHDVSKAIDNAAGAEREVIGASPFADRKPRGTWTGEVYGEEPSHGAGPQLTAPATPDAIRWTGWGTALKPASEPIIVARKPLAGTVAANVLEHGTGALNIDGCRVAALDGGSKVSAVRSEAGRNKIYGRGLSEPGRVEYETPDGGRWPANVVMSHPPVLGPGGEPVGDACAEGCVSGCPVAELDRQSGVTVSGQTVRRAGSVLGNGVTHGHMVSHTDTIGGYDDAGGASRFFPVFRYEAKAPASERPRLADGTAHPTVKPQALMSWLVRLVTPSGGLVLDPFAGSGTTLAAAVAEGMRAVGVEQHRPYADLVVQRLSGPIVLGLFGEIA